MTETIEDDRDVRRAIAEIDILSGEGQAFERLGGLTNRVYRVGSMCLRLPGRGTEAYIDRKNEAVAAREAARAGVSPDVLHFGEDGVMVTRYVDDAVTMTAEAFSERAGAPARAARAFADLHRSGAVFPFRFELFAMIDSYLAILSDKNAELPAGYHEVVAEAQAVRRALDATPAELAPCHCDPLCENFLDDGKRMWIVDWEYSGMNDPLWDLGDLCVEGAFDAAMEDELLRSYFGRSPSAAEHGRVVIYKAMCDLLWTLWGLIQHADGNPAEDFWAYATNRFERCKALMASKDFAGHVDAVERGGG